MFFVNISYCYSLSLHSLFDLCYILCQACLHALYGYAHLYFYRIFRDAHGLSYLAIFLTLVAAHHKYFSATLGQR